MRRWPNIGLLLIHRLRRWPNGKPTLGQRLKFAGIVVIGDEMVSLGFKELG